MNIFKCEKSGRNWVRLIKKIFIIWKGYQKNIQNFVLIDGKNLWNFSPQKGFWGNFGSFEGNFQDFGKV